METQFNVTELSGQNKYFHIVPKTLYYGLLAFNAKWTASQCSPNEKNAKRSIDEPLEVELGHKKSNEMRSEYRTLNATSGAGVELTWSDLPLMASKVIIIHPVEEN